MRSGWFGLPFFGARQEPALVTCTLSGGGSRASFHIGALRYLYSRDERFTPTTFVGASAGAILASGLAQYADHDAQAQWIAHLERIWLGMQTSEDMFTPRTWYRKLLDEGPNWLEIVSPPEPVRPTPKRRLTFFSKSTPETPESPPSPLDPVEFALTPDSDIRAEWSLQHLSALAGQVGKLPRIGTNMSSIWSGLERTQSMYRPGPVLRELLEPECFQPERVHASGATLRVAMVALESGELRYMTERGTLVDRDNQPFDDRQHDLVLGLLASCSIPGVFRAVPIDDETYVDGGTRENLPAELAIGLLGGSRNYVISSQSGGVRRRANMADDNIFSVIMRSTEILIDEAGRDELEYAISAGAVAIYPDVDVHDAMVVHPGLTRIFRDHGWLRAADVHLEVDARLRRRHRRIIEQRLHCLGAEQRWLDDPQAPGVRDDVADAKLTLRDLMTQAHPAALPPEAESWWTGFEPHTRRVPVDAWWR